MENKKQNVVGRFSVESEFQAITQGLCELLRLKMILERSKDQME